MGMQQAQNLSLAIQAQIKNGMPPPESLYVSPLTRSTDTLNITFSGWFLGKKNVPEPVIIEGLRETIVSRQSRSNVCPCLNLDDDCVQGVHTCDNRSNKTFIHKRYPKWLFEKGFAEVDPFWTPTDRETSVAQQARARSALVEILNKDKSTCEFTPSLTRCRGDEHAVVARYRSCVA